MYTKMIEVTKTKNGLHDPFHTPCHYKLVLASKFEVSV